MNKQMNNVVLIGVMILFLTACGQLGPASTPAPIVTSSPVEMGDSPTAVLAAGLAPEKLSHYIGLNYPPLPEGLSEGFSMLIQDTDDYGLFQVTDSENKMLWLGKLTHLDSNGNAYWEVKDVLDLSALDAGLTLIPDGCSLNGLPDSEIFVVGKDGVIILAWRANTTLNVFEVIPLDGIKCHSDKAMNL